MMFSGRISLPIERHYDFVRILANLNLELRNSEAIGGRLTHEYHDNLAESILKFSLYIFHFNLRESQGILERATSKAMALASERALSVDP